MTEVEVARGSSTLAHVEHSIDHHDDRSDGIDRRIY